MIPLKIEDGLLLSSITITHKGQTLHLERVLIDTGSGGTIISTDKASSIGILPEEHDTIYRVRGVGGSEFVYSKNLDQLSIGSLTVREFETEIGAMNYGFELDGIIGLDFLLKTKAVIDLDNPSLYTKNS